MTLQSDLIQSLITLDTLAGNRVFDDQVMQSVPFPFIAMTVLTANRTLTLRAEPLFKRATIRVAIFARSAVDRDVIADELRTAYHGFKGMIGTTDVSSIRVEDSSDSVELADGDNLIKGKGLDLFFVYY